MEKLKQEHQQIEPKILYYGTPVVLLTTLNEDGTTNISPISSSWALGDVIVMGVGPGGKALENSHRHPECVLNLPDVSMWEAVERLAPLTGKKNVPEYKLKQGFRFEKDKFKSSGLTPVESMHVTPQSIKECPIQIETDVMNIKETDYDIPFAIIEVEKKMVKADPDIILDDHYIDPAKWHPLIYNFRHYFGLGEERGRTFKAER